MKEAESPQIRVQHLGQIGYQQAWDYQEALLQENLSIKKQARLEEPPTDPRLVSTRHYFLLCEHPHVYTLGKSGHLSHLLFSEQEMEEKGIQFFPTNRGGDITYHGPGQIVGYPILDLEKFKTDIGLYLRNMEEVIIRTLAHFGITAGRSQGETGVWLEADIPGRERKICAMGVRCSRWVTMHGFALNVNTNLDYFKGIIPCGIVNKQVSSMEAETGRIWNIDEVKEIIIREMGLVFQAKMEPLPVLTPSV